MDYAKFNWADEKEGRNSLFKGFDHSDLHFRTLCVDPTYYCVWTNLWDNITIKYLFGNKYLGEGIKQVCE